MPSFQDDFFPSCNGSAQIHVRRCVPDGAVRGIVQIAHGIAEHVERYDAFAAFLASQGFLTVANDHLGHGQSVQEEADIGFFAESGGWELAVSDMHRLFTITREEFPALPYFLFGHSMGSFLARTYVIRYPDDLSGAIFCGTGQQAKPLVLSGLLLGRREVKKHGPRYRSKLLNQLAFGSYNKGYSTHRTDYDWLTRDESVVDAYIADPLCGFVPSAGLFTDMMSGIDFISRPGNLRQMNRKLPVFFISGFQDPVGENGKGVQRAYAAFLKIGMEDVSLKLYPDCRHELLNELNKAEVMQDIADWVESKI